MNKRIQKKKHKQAEHAHEQQLGDTSWGRITLSFEHLQDAFGEFVQTLAQELMTYGQGLRGDLQDSARSVDESMAPHISKVPMVGPSVAKGIHEFATDPHFAGPNHH